MFDERRHRITAGIDKSYLLEPITVETKTTTTTKRVIAPSKPTRYDQKMSNYSKVIVPPLQNRMVNHDVNGNNHFSANDDQLDGFRAGELRSGTKPLGVTASKTVVTRKLTPAVTSPPPLKNVTNQKVKHRHAMAMKIYDCYFDSRRWRWKSFFYDFLWGKVGFSAIVVGYVFSCVKFPFIRVPSLSRDSR